MAWLRTFFYCILLCVTTATVLAEGKDSLPSGVPSLPPEENKIIPNRTQEKGEEETSIIHYDQNREIRQGTLNALELSGYFRTRFSYFRDGHLRTYIPALKRGTSMMMPNLSLLSIPADGAASDDQEKTDQNPPQNSFFGNMRLRVNPTINVSEMVRIKGTIDVFDNLVLGSTPSYLMAGSPSPSTPVSFMSMSQNAPMGGINSWQGAISVKRAWAEADFAIGELRFGRMPMHFGLGILYNAGNDITSDYGDQVDGISFTTRFFDHFVTPSYHLAYTGPAARGGGLIDANNFPSFYLPVEAGQRYPLESG